jgi:signal transduction histidine kinase
MGAATHSERDVTESTLRAAERAASEAAASGVLDVVASCEDLPAAPMTGASVTSAPDAGAMGLSPNDLAELVGAFNEVTDRLERTHTALRAEVVRLNRELSETKDQLARARELAALGEMAAGIAHEVRNPLGSIRLYAEALVEDLPDQPAERDVASRIVRSVQRLDGIVGDVLAFSRELRLRKEVISAAALLTDAAEQCRGRAGERDVRLRVMPIDEELTVRGDAALLRQAVTNIVSNAIDAAAERVAGGDVKQGEVELFAHGTSVRTAAGGRDAATGLLVRDNGPGIPDDVRARLFNPFFTTRETGTGLGLAIVHRIIDAHAGTVVIHDRGLGDAGAAVELKLPNRDEREHTSNEQSGGDAASEAGGMNADRIAEHKPPRETRSVNG